MNLTNFNLEASGKAGKLFSIAFETYKTYKVRGVKSVLIMHPTAGKCNASNVCEIIKKLQSTACNCDCGGFVFGYINKRLYVFIPKSYSCEQVNLQVGFYRYPEPIVDVSTEIDFKHPHLFELFVRKSLLESEGKLTATVNKQIEKEMRKHDHHKPSQKPCLP